MKHTYSAGGVVLNTAGEVLLIREGPTFWGLPKGTIEADEDALAAAKREIQEESGLTMLNFIGELGSYERHPYNFGNEDRTELKHIQIFLFVTTEPLPQDNVEHNLAAWFAPHDAVAQLTQPKDADFLQHALPAIHKLMRKH